MKLLLVDNAHLYKTPNGNYYTSSIYGYDFFRRYLHVFSSVRFAAKTKYVNSIDENKFLMVSGPNLEIFEIPWYEGVRDLIHNLFRIKKQIKGITKSCDLIIYRVAQIESFIVYLFANHKKPFALEMVNDPQSFKDVNFIIRFTSVYLIKRMIIKSIGISYVTKSYLQNKYPVNGGNKIVENYSSIDLDPKLILSPRNYIDLKKLKLVHVTNNIYGAPKGHREVIEIVSILNKQGISAQISFIGDGDEVPFLKTYSIKLGIQEKVIFLGKLKGQKEVITELQKHDIFVFPSFYEGLPRVIVEAQAAGLPCIASNVGGISELIASENLFQYNDVSSFVERLKFLYNNPHRLSEISKENISISKSYTRDNLQIRRNNFYSKLVSFVYILNHKND